MYGAVLQDVAARPIKRRWNENKQPDFIILRQSSGDYVHDLAFGETMKTKKSDAADKTAIPTEVDINDATSGYETWMASCTTIVPSHLRLKHEQMRESPFQFLRGTFYRWAQLWPSACSDLCEAAEVLAVGDLHVNSFGTWRDAEGRLCWGVDDFDESYRLPYTNDLERLATSMKIVIDAEGLAVKLKEGCELLLEGYTKCLKEGGHPLVLAKREQNLERLGVDSFKPPTDFWGKLNRLPPIRHPLNPDIKRALQKTLPDLRMEYKVVRREAGLEVWGSNGLWRSGFGRAVVLPEKPRL